MSTSKDMTGSESGWAPAKHWCPHVAEHVKSPTFTAFDQYKCADCGNKGENWMCLSSHYVGCGRFVEGHMLAHNEKTKHPIAISFADLGIWCYECDSYLSHKHIPQLTEIYNNLHKAKFGTLPPDAARANEDDHKTPALDTVSEDVVEDEEEEEEEEAKIAGDDDVSESLTEGIEKLSVGAEGSDSDSDSDKPQVETALPTLDLDGLADALKSGKFKNVIVMAGAGISVSAGIPDFRTPGTGLYDNLQEYNLPSPEAIFTLDFFRNNPKPFCMLAKELFPGEYEPTPSHHFLKVLHDQGVLLRCYTQNIDGLEEIAGVPADKIVQAHGGFGSAACIDCDKEHQTAWVKEEIFADRIPTCTSPDCSSYVKPDIVFFGEGLPRRFHSLVREDFPQCDLLIVMGTSLAVQPFASLTEEVPGDAVRVLVNREAVGTKQRITSIPPALQRLLAQMGHSLGPREKQAFLNQFSQGTDDGFAFLEDDNVRDIFLEGDCDDTIERLMKAVGGDMLQTYTACTDKKQG